MPEEKVVKMEPEHIIEETATIPGADIEKVSDDCIDWLKKNRAEIINIEKPWLIQANHRRGLDLALTTPEDWHKNISIKLEQLGDDVKVHLLMDTPRTSRRNHVRKVKSYWPLLVENLWRTIGVEIDGDLLHNLYPISALEFILNDMRKELIGAFLVLNSPILLGIIGNILTKANLDMLSIIGYFVMVTLLVIWIGGKKYLHVRNLQLDLYPDR
jgi:hypothetical protein